MTIADFQVERANEALVEASTTSIRETYRALENTWGNSYLPTFNALVNSYFVTQHPENDAWEDSDIESFLVEVNEEMEPGDEVWRPDDAATMTTVAEAVSIFAEHQVNAINRIYGD